jgi:hypothetical protein
LISTAATLPSFVEMSRKRGMGLVVAGVAGQLVKTFFG